MIISSPSIEALRKGCSLRECCTAFIKKGRKVKWIPFSCNAFFSLSLIIHKSVTSASSITVTNTVVCWAIMRFFEIVLLTPLRGTRSTVPYMSSAFLVFSDAFITSSFVMLPPGPEPLSVLRLTPSSFAKALTAGVARIASSSSGKTPTTETDFGLSSTTSPSSVIVIKTSPTFTISPSSLLIFNIFPFLGDGTSTTALSVSNSRTVWCSSTESPSLTIHFLISPSVIPSPKSGNVKSKGMFYSFSVMLNPESVMLNLVQHLLKILPFQSAFTQSVLNPRFRNKFGMTNKLTYGKITNISLPPQGPFLFLPQKANSNPQAWEEGSQHHIL